jgi:hypothetical protein
MGSCGRGCGGRAAIRWHVQGGGAGLGQKPETEQMCSVSGVLCETAVERGEVRWWGGVVAMVVVVWPSSGICKVGEWVCAKKAETEQTRSVSGMPCETVEGRGGVVL